MKIRIIHSVGGEDETYGEKVVLENCPFTVDWHVKIFLLGMHFY